MSIIKRLKSILDEMDFIGMECAIDSLMRIDEDNFDRCSGNHVGGCYYCVHDFHGKQILSYVRVCNSRIGEDLREVR